MATRVVTTMMAEQYERVLMQFQADFRSWSDPPISGLGAQSRRIGKVGGSLDGNSVGIPYLLAVVEQFCVTRLDSLSTGFLPSGAPLVETIWRAAFRDVESSWQKQRKAWKDWYGVSWSSFPDIGRFEGYQEARNTIMHGLGRLTPRQMGRDSGAGTRQKLLEAGIKIHGNEIRVTRADQRDCALACRDFIRWLDLAAQVSTPRST
jgi:hypothetical protein